MGAFDYGPYKKGMDGTNDPRLAAALRAIKTELIYNGYTTGIDPETPVFGTYADRRLREFQAAVGLTVDGQAGVQTCTALFRKRVVSVEQSSNLPYGSLGKMLYLESSYDPVAVGVADPDDHGIAQINLRIHSNVTETQSYSPEFAMTWAVNYITDNRAAIIGSLDFTKAARASYNVGVYYAGQWMKQDFPANGMVVNGIDWFARATKYLRLIDQQIW